LVIPHGLLGILDMNTEVSNDEVWVFGYGSLMWRPGFEFAERRVARLHGYHRHFCVWSHRYRGSPKVPGLVLGLDRGGSCRGVAYRIAPDRADHVLAYLHEREMITGVYQPRRLEMNLVVGDEQPRRIVARTYVVDQAHPQYAGALFEEELAALVIQGVGTAGPCLEYLINTVEHLGKIGIPDGRLERMLALVQEMQSGRAPMPTPPAGPPAHAANLHRA
jgi:glutathione-specific gamma-glutamylcyclotransferase